jgi:hypothetical protein
MCYGDIAWGRDGYYEEQMRQHDEVHQEEREADE